MTLEPSAWLPTRHSVVVLHPRVYREWAEPMLRRVARRRANLKSLHNQRHWRRRQGAWRHAR